MYKLPTVCVVVKDNIGQFVMTSREKVTIGHYDLEAVLSRMKEVAGARNNTELANGLSLSFNTFQKAISRGRIPDKHLLHFCALYDVTVDWLLTGFRKDSDKMSFSCCTPPEKRELLDAALEVLTSDTIHAKALEQNIRAFAHAVRMEKQMGEMDSRLRLVEKELMERDQVPPSPAGSSADEAM